MSAAERNRGKRAAARANLLVVCANTIVTGAVMMLYASDVLGFSGKRIASILALAPVAACLRLPLLGWASRFGLTPTLRFSAAVNILVVLALIAIPAAWLPYSLFFGLLLAFSSMNQLGWGMAWQPLLRGITTAADRGQFFARMRFQFTVLSGLVLAAIPLAVGERMTEGVYKALLILAALGLGNFYFWVGQVPEGSRAARGAGDDAEVGHWARLGALIRHSPLLRVPLLINVLLALGAMPLFVVYLRQLLHYPTDVVSAYIFTTNVGMAVSLLVWGRVADTVGFRPMLVGLLAVAIVLSPLYLLLVPVPAGATLHEMPRLSLGILLFLGLAGGALGAGTGIATTAIQHHHVRQQDAVEAMNVFALIVVVATAAGSLVAGYWLDDLALPRGSFPLAGGQLAFDWVKGMLLFFVMPLQAAALVLCRWMPNMRAHFGVGDFFASLGPDAMRTLFAQRYAYHEDDNKRAETARWMGGHAGPLAIDPLADMLADPSYDVKVEAVRSLARTGSPAAGERLLAVLENERKRQLADHVAWALGELRYLPAFDALVKRLAPTYSARIRAMAARALGKLGDRRAVEPVVALLRAERESQHVIGSACWALLQMAAHEHARLIFDALLRLPDREERFELIHGLCEPLGISNEWLLRYTEEAWAIEALDQFIAHQSAAWQTRHRAVIEMFRARNLATLASLVREAVTQTPCDAQPILQALNESLAASKEWHSLAVLASAWLLLRE